MPRVTVLMSVFNGEKYLREAVESILNQTYTDFEFLIIDDGTIDRSAEIIRSYDDQRIRLVRNEKTIGLGGSLNKGFDMAKGGYIVRMDSDDVSLADRLKQQVEFMDNNEHIGISGTGYITIGERKGIRWNPPSDPNIIMARLLFENVLAHPTVIFRSAIIRKYQLYYDPSIGRAQDYDLWKRAEVHTSLSNIVEPLLLYRIHGDQATSQHCSEQERTASGVRRALLDRFGKIFSEQEYALHNEIGSGRIHADKKFIGQADAWMQKLLVLNADKPIYPEPAFSRAICEYWFRIIQAAAELGLWTFLFYARSPLRKISHSRWSSPLRLFAMCIAPFGIPVWNALVALRNNLEAQTLKTRKSK